MLERLLGFACRERVPCQLAEPRGLAAVPLLECVEDGGVEVRPPGERQVVVERVADQDVRKPEPASSARRVREDTSRERLVEKLEHSRLGCTGGSAQVSDLELT